MGLPLYWLFCSMTLFNQVDLLSYWEAQLVTASISSVLLNGNCNLLWFQGSTSHWSPTSSFVSPFPSLCPWPVLPNCATYSLCGRPLSFLVTHWLLSGYLCSLLTVPVSATAKDTAGRTDRLDSALGSFLFPQMCVCFPILHLAICPCYLFS